MGRVGGCGEAVVGLAWACGEAGGIFAMADQRVYKFL
jgi:hypothetical protein